MGNTVAIMICGVRSEKELVTVLQSNGKVMEFSQKVRAAEIMLGHPNHFICNASVIISCERGTMLPPRAFLQRGKIYLLLPLPVDHLSATRSCSSSSKTKLQRDSRPMNNTKPITKGTCTKFVISKEYLDKIMSQGGSGEEQENRSPAAVAAKLMAPAKRRSSRSWTPALESISEVLAR